MQYFVSFRLSMLLVINLVKPNGVVCDA